MAIFRRSLGRSGLEVSALGMGCWAIGGPFAWKANGSPSGWGRVDDRESLRALGLALDIGVTFFDTAAAYGCGHSERLLGSAVAARRDEIVIATKFGYEIDEDRREISEGELTPDSIEAECDASLRRLNTDRIDLYQFHRATYDVAAADEVLATLEKLVGKGKIRSYAWSTDDPERAELFAKGEHCTAVQQRLNLFEGNHEVLAVCEKFDLASIIRSPLGMGILTGKFSKDSKVETPDDVRKDWDFGGGDIAEKLDRLAALREALTSSGRTLAQGAIAWLWGKSERTIPIPGFKTSQQVEENAGAARFGPLTPEEMKQVDEVLQN